MSITYGDPFTLPSITDAETGEPITWQVYDVRSIEDAGSTHERRASFEAIDPATGNRLSTLTEIKIGRALRTIGDFKRPGADWRGGFLWVSLHSVNFTADAKATIDSEVAALDFDLPTLTVEELRERLITSAADWGRSAAHVSGYNSHAPWGKYRQHDEARTLLGEALDIDTRRKMHAAMVEAFAAASAEGMRVAIGEGEEA